MTDVRGCERSAAATAVSYMGRRGQARAVARLWLAVIIVKYLAVCIVHQQLHCVSKKLHSFYFCNNFVDPGPIWIIFGRYVANEFSSGLHGLGYHAGLSVSDTDT